jgi:hypothetical protein
MEIYENQKGTINDGKHDVILIISYKEARILNEAMEEYCKNNKRKKNAKKMFNQIYKELPY